MLSAADSQVMARGELHNANYKVGSFLKYLRDKSGASDNLCDLDTLSYTDEVRSLCISLFSGSKVFQNVIYGVPLREMDYKDRNMFIRAQEVLSEVSEIILEVFQTISIARDHYERLKKTPSLQARTQSTYSNASESNKISEIPLVMDDIYSDSSEIQPNQSQGHYFEILLNRFAEATIENNNPSLNSIDFEITEDLRHFDSISLPKDRLSNAISYNASESRIDTPSEDDIKMSIEYLEEVDHFLVIDNVADSNLVVTTSELSGLIKLKYAIVHQVLGLVEAKKWYEILDLLDVSRQGRHGIFIKKTNRNVPELVASTRILSIGEENVYNSPFFRTPNWKLLSSKKKLQEKIEAHNQLFPQYTIKVDYSLIHDNLDDLATFEDDLILAAGEENIAEPIRYCLDSKKIKGDPEKGIDPDPNLFFEGTLGLSKTMREPISIVIVEATTMRWLRSLEKMTGYSCYEILSSHKIYSNDKGETYKAVIFNRGFEMACKIAEESMD